MPRCVEDVLVVHADPCSSFNLSHIVNPDVVWKLYRLTDQVKWTSKLYVLDQMWTKRMWKLQQLRCVGTLSLQHTTLSIRTTKSCLLWPNIEGIPRQ